MSPRLDAAVTLAILCTVGFLIACIAVSVLNSVDKIRNRPVGGSWRDSETQT